MSEPSSKKHRGQYAVTITREGLPELRMELLVAALVCGDLPAVECALAEVLAALAHNPAAVSLLNQQATTFSGMRLIPLQAALCSPLPEEQASTVALRVLELGANPNVRWLECGGPHTPLSKALLQRHTAGGQLADTLLARGADPTAALLHTALLESSRFDAGVVRRLIEAGAEVDHLLATQVLLSKLQHALCASRRLSKLHGAAGDHNEQWLLQRAGACFELFLAAGAPPADTSQAEAAGLEPRDWASLAQHASRPPTWSPATHHLFPPHFRRAARELLFVGALRGFLVAPQHTPQPHQMKQDLDSRCVEEAADAEAKGHTPAAASTVVPSEQVFWLDGGIIHNIILQLAPSTRYLRPVPS